MSGAHEGCSQGKSVRDREGSKHSTAATPERVDSEAAVLPQDFEDTVHARQLKALCRRVGRRMSRQGPGRSPSMGLTHLNAARPREKVEWGPALREFENFVGSRFTPACNTSIMGNHWQPGATRGDQGRPVAPVLARILCTTVLSTKATQNATQVVTLST